jgi:hypothetical protein
MKNIKTTKPGPVTSQLAKSNMAYTSTNKSPFIENKVFQMQDTS